MSEPTDHTDSEPDRTKKGVGRRAVLLGAVGGGALVTLAHAAPAAKPDNLSTPDLQLASFTGTLDGLTSMYGLAGSPSNHSWRARWDKFMNNSTDFHFVVLADSLFGGWDGTAYHFDSSILRSMGRELCRRTGKTFAGGAQLAGGDSAGHVADNVALSGGAFSQGVWIAIVNVGSIVVTLKDPGTSIAFAYSDSGTNTIPYKIDGVTQTPITKGNTATIQGHTASGLSSGLHTLEFDNTAGNTIAISGWRCWDPSVPQLHTHVGSIGGTRANSGTATLNWSNTTSTGVGYIVPATLAALGVPAVPDFVVCSAGANDISNSVAPATAAAGLANMRNYYSTSPALLVAEPMVHGSSLPNTQTFLTDVYSQGDTLVVPVFDLDNYFGAGSQGDGNATANSDGLLSSTDQTHPLQFTQQSLGQHLAGALLGAA